MMDFADVPCALGKLLHRAGFRVDAVEVAPVVPFGDPEHMLAVRHQVAPEVVVVDEGVALLIGQDADLAVLGVHGAELVALVTALVILVGEPLGVRGPLTQFQEVLVHLHGLAQRDDFLAGHVDEHGDGLRQDVTGLRIVQVAVLGLHLVRRAGFAQDDLALLEHLLPQGGELRSVRRPEDPRVGIAVGAVAGELGSVFTVDIAHPDVVILDISGFGAVRGRSLSLLAHSVLALVRRIVVAVPANGLDRLLEGLLVNGGLHRPRHFVPGVSTGLMGLEIERILRGPHRPDGTVVDLFTCLVGELRLGIQLIEILGLLCPVSLGLGGPGSGGEGGQHQRQRDYGSFHGLVIDKFS